MYGKHGEVWLEPVGLEDEDKYRGKVNEARPHLLFRRVHRHNDTVLSATKAGKLRKKQKLRQTLKIRDKHNKPRRMRKQKHERNCGTRGELTNSKW